MRYSSSHWLAGGVLALAVLGGGLVALSTYAQQAPPSSYVPADWAGTKAGADGPAGVSSAANSTPLDGRPPSLIQRQGDLLRYSRDVPGDAKPILIDADQIVTWDHDGNVVLLLTGRVLVQQSVAQCRFHQGVAWVDMRRYQSTGVLHVDFYAEGQVRIDAGGELADAGRAVLALTTRGEFKLRAGKGKVSRENRSNDPVVRRGSALVRGPATPAVPQPSKPQPQQPALPPVPGTTMGGLPPLPGITPVSNPAPRTETAPGPQPGAMPQLKAPRPVPTPAAGGSVRQPLSDAKPAGRRDGELRGGEGGTPGAKAPAAPSGVQLVQAVPGKDGAGSGKLPPPESLSPAAPRTTPLTVPEPPHRVRQPRPSTLPAPRPASDPLPPPVPVPGPGPAPLPPPSRPALPPRPGQLPPTSSPDRPLEHRLSQRTGETQNLNIERIGPGREIITVTGGLILNVRNVPKIGIIDVEADRAVIWVNKRDANQVANNLRSEQGESSTELEFYVAGHVVLRSTQPGGRDQIVLEANELYYNAKRNVSVALDSRLEVRTTRFAGGGKSIHLDDPITLRAPQILRTGPNTFEVFQAAINASKLPSDPELNLFVDHATLTNRSRPKTRLFGWPATDKFGNPVLVDESILEATDVWTELYDVPVFYTPYLRTDIRDPLGPLEGVAFGVSRVQGAHVGITLDGYKLLGLDPAEGTRWQITPDYLSRRGPALGSVFEYNGKFDSLCDPNDIYGTTPRYDGLVRANGIYDEAQDILGGNRPYLPFDPPGFRGRLLWRQGFFDLPYGISVQSQLAFLSDRNYLEQYFKREFDLEPNQANYLYARQQQDNLAFGVLAQFRQADWITTTQWLPRADGYLIGESLFNLITSNTQVHAGFASLKESSDPLLPLRVPGMNPALQPLVDVDPTTRDLDTARAAVVQEFGIPLHLGAFNVMPYAKGALVGYTSDLTGQEAGQAWGGLGLRGSIPFTRLYPDVESELFNLKGINHKVVSGMNYFYARAAEPYSRFPQLDRLHDDATLSMLREIKPFEPAFNGNSGIALATSPLYDPQLYAIRRLVDNRLDTLDDIHAVQFDVRQRLQTKRGYPGYEHVVDWMTLNSSITFFPEADRDNFGRAYSFMEYQYLWNIGDRTAFESTGWYDPHDKGARVYTVGLYFNRPDRTTFYLGYRQIDPLQSRMVTGSMTYIFSPKYSMTGTVAYDFGTSEAITNTLVFTRTGTDLQVSMGFTYNSLQNNFGAIIQIVPNLVPFQRGMMPTGMMAPQPR